MNYLSYGVLGNIQDVSDPIFQVLGHTAIPGSVPTRYRLHLSDGLFYTGATILDTQLNHLLSDGCLDEFTVIQITRLVCNKVPTKPHKLVLIILELMVIVPGAQVGSKIGNPVKLGFATPTSPSPGTTCPHCCRHNHPPQLGSSGPTRQSTGPQSAVYRQALRAIAAAHDPTSGLGDLGHVVTNPTDGLHGFESDESSSAASPPGDSAPH